MILYIASTILTIGALFLVRIQVFHRYRARLISIGRRAERERIARELHDTLLQGAHALLIRLDRCSKAPALPDPGRQEIEAVAAQMRALVIESRDRIVQLRQPLAEHPDIVRELNRLVSQTSAPANTSIDVSAEGVARPLSPHAYPQIFDIAREAIRNACHHSRATRIEVSVRYRQSALQIEVADDGCGFPAPSGPPRYADSHFGILGMYERAEQLRAHLTFHSARGTRVTLRVPGRHAYGTQLAADAILSPRPDRETLRTLAQPCHRDE